MVETAVNLEKIHSALTIGISSSFFLLGDETLTF